MEHHKLIFWLMMSHHWEHMAALLSIFKVGGKGGKFIVRYNKTPEPF